MYFHLFCRCLRKPSSRKGHLISDLKGTFCSTPREILITIFKSAKSSDKFSCHVDGVRLGFFPFNKLKKKLQNLFSGCTCKSSFWLEMRCSVRGVNWLIPIPFSSSCGVTGWELVWKTIFKIKWQGELHPPELLVWINWGKVDPQQKTNALM